MPDFVLQRILAPLPSRPGELYLRHQGAVQLLPGKRTTFRLDPGSMIDFDTYFGAFFESQWLAHAALPRLRLRATVSAGLEIKVSRTSCRARVLLKKVTADRDGAIEIVLPQHDDRNEPVRVSLEVHAATVAGEISDIGWVCDGNAPPTRLLLGLCAYSERERALQSAAAFATDPGLVEALERIVVVDQSAGGDTPVPLSRVEVVRQANFGGTGGFARIMLEALSDPSLTHVLLLDDDVEIDPEVVRRVSALCRILPAPRIIAGQMLDMLQPTTVLESGATLDLARLRVKPRSHRVNAITELDLLMPRSRIDYAAWYCCALPLETVRRCGLPLPFFINFDDVEYGLRTAAAGVPTISVSGIGVWHLPGYAKDDDWRHHFYHRNIAVIASIHRIASNRRLAANFARRAVKAIWRGNPYRLALACSGTEEFLAGPARVSASPEQVLKRIAELQQTLPASWNRRAPGTIARLVPRALFCVVRLMLGGRLAMHRWRDRYSTLVSQPWWQSYLGIVPSSPP